MSARAESLLEELLLEQRVTNQLLVALIGALAEEADPDDEPMTYMDGTPV